MKNKHLRAGWVWIVAAVCGAATQVFAGGFQTGVLSVRGIGMGGVTVSILNDPTVVSANPAALSTLRGTHFSIGTIITMPDYAFTSGSSGQSAKMQSQVLFPPTFALTHTFAGGVGFGVSAGIPYFAKTDWGENWPGNRIVTSSEIRGVYVTPAVSFGMPDFSVGVGLRLIFFRMNLNRRFAAQTAAPGAELSTIYATGSAAASHALQIGLLYHPSPVLSVGLVFESRARVRIDEGSIDYGGLPEGSAEIAAASTFSTEMTVPDNWHAGVSLEPIPALLLSGEVQFVRWSAFHRTPMIIGSGSAQTVWVEQAGWRDSWIARIGAEVRLFDIEFRLGLSMDQSPIPGEELRPSLPDADRTGYSLGLGYEVGEGLRLDFALESVRYKQRTVQASKVMLLPGVPFNGTYDLSSTVAALNVRYSWNNHDLPRQPSR